MSDAVRARFGLRAVVGLLGALALVALLASPASAASRAPAAPDAPPGAGAGATGWSGGHGGRYGHDRAGRARTARVATYNLYLGADLQPLLSATDQASLAAAAAAVYAHVQQTDFPSRAEALASLIAGAEPDVVGLQEVALWQTADLTQPGGPTFTPSLDYLAILLADLAAAGHPYKAVSTSVNFTTAGIGPGGVQVDATTLVSFTDRDVVLVRADDAGPALDASNPQSGHYAATLPATLAGTTIEIPRGWASADIRLDGRAFRFVTTHLEAYSPLVRAAQAVELAGMVAASPLPVVLVGDINSQPDDSAGAYGILTGSGLVDSWTEAMDGDPGWTSGQSADLTNTESQLDHRIDDVFHSACGIAAVPGSGDVIGDDAADRTPGGLWPSDHAGVAISLRLRQPAWAVQPAGGGHAAPPAVLAGCVG